jgi:hypothetical protein
MTTAKFVWVKEKAIEILKDAKMVELKELAKTEGWAEFWNNLKDSMDGKDLSRKISFIGVTKAELVEYIANTQQLKFNNSQKEKELAAEQTSSQPKEDSDEEESIITLKEVASMLGTNEKALRRKLRNKGMKKPGGRWEWQPEDSQLKEIMTWKEA